MAKKWPEGYTPPEDTVQAYNFGKTNGRVGSERLGFIEVVPHPERVPFAKSIYKAYCKGWRQGKHERIQRLARLARYYDVAPPCMEFVWDKDELSQSGSRYCEVCGYTEPEHRNRTVRRAAWIQAILHAFEDDEAA